MRNFECSELINRPRSSIGFEQRRRRRFEAITASGWVLLAGLAAAQARERPPTDPAIIIEPGTLSRALLDLARQTGLEIFEPEAPLACRRVDAVVASNAYDALARLLDGSGCEGRIADGSIRIESCTPCAPLVA